MADWKRRILNEVPPIPLPSVNPIACRVPRRCTDDMNQTQLISLLKEEA